MRRKSATRKNRKLQSARRSPQAAPQRDPGECMIVAIGASAGGIEATTELMRSLPPDTGMAFVLIQHLDPKHQSILTQLMSKETAMRVVEVDDGMTVEANHVYVIPPNAMMSISKRVLHLSPRDNSHGHPTSIDQFMRSLAEEHGSNAVGVILSGSGSDGTLGLAEIRAQGGVTFAQDETTAKYDAMPRSAIAAGCVDYVLPPVGVARELTRIAQHPYVVRSRAAEGPELLPEEDVPLSMIFDLLRKASGVDFSYYRRTTILRRIQRRMVVHKIKGLKDYTKYVQTNPAEIKSLYQDILIHVTRFFRNPGVFEALKTLVFPSILEARKTEAAIRLWAPGCASGEETYSLAIALLEFLGPKASRISIQLFGTDVSETGIAKARTGLYPENIQVDVSAERLRRFFVKVEGGYRISETIRQMCVFSQHNVLDDPPFSRMDVICCRNLLIYLEPVLQHKIISVFHYAARSRGFLVLGTSEGVGGSTHLFALEDRLNKIFSKNAAARSMVSFSLNKHAEPPEYGGGRVPVKHSELARTHIEAQREFDRRLLTLLTPATVFTNQDLEVVHSRGNVDRFLKLAPGRASLGILKMAPDGLLFDLRSALNRAKKENTKVRKRNVPIKGGPGDGNVGENDKLTRYVDFEVSPVKVSNLNEQYFMITFEDANPESGRKTPPLRSLRAARLQTEAAQRASQLEQELSGTKEYLSSLIENQEATNEELQSANEEILSSNEELQSTNEELETAKEELQSANEELTTVNDELRHRNAEVTQVNNDLTNLLSSTDIAMLMLDNDLVIRRFSPQAREILGLIPGDLGRPFLNINPSIEIPDLQQMIVQVISNFTTVEREVRDRTGVWYQLRILPYRTLDNRVDGCVITLVDISKSKPVEQRFRPGQGVTPSRATDLDSQLREFILVLDTQLQVRAVSPSFCNAFQLTREEIENQPFREIHGGLWTNPKLEEALQEAAETGKPTEDIEIEQEFPHLGKKRLRLGVRAIEAGGVMRILAVSMTDITDHPEDISRNPATILDLIHDAVRVRDRVHVKKVVRQTAFRSDLRSRGA
jgi:two-component system, chemotaxis family, CheB/CheR fusion protein